MEHKILKMHWSTWRNLRGYFPGLPGETIDHYFRRINLELKKLHWSSKIKIIE